VSHPNDDRARARARALATARAITLGLAVAGAVTVAGCESLEARYCEQFPDTGRCCTRAGGSWDQASNTCIYSMPVMGPLVPPA
jgi:hypothetical protein